MAYKHIIKAALYALTGANLGLQPDAHAQNIPIQRPVVVELFTSQGCSSCPPADKLLEELTSSDQVLPLSFHVDYWDRLGWKDPFSHVHFSERQALYNAALKTPGNYTPQMVVDGAYETIGSYKAALENLIYEARTNATQVPISLEAEASGLMVTVPETPIAAPASLWLVGYDNQRTTYIGGGENRGQQLSSFNVVRYLERIGTFEGKPLTLHVQFHWQEPTDNLAVLLQEHNIGRVLGVGMLKSYVPQ